MKLKHSIFSATLLILFSCSCNQAQKDKKERTKQSNTLEIIWIETTGSTSNFESLLSTNHLYYLRDMSVDYDNYGKESWKSIDTVKNDNWTITRHRKGQCQESTDSLKTEFCMEHQTHIINKKLNKVIKFSGSGSGYIANIEYVYDELGKLIEYNENNNKIFYLKYDTENQLTEIIKTEIRNGIKKKTGLIKFK